VSNHSTPNASPPDQSEIRAGDPIVYGLTETYFRTPSYIQQDPELDARHYFLYGVLVKYVSIGRATGFGAMPSRETLARECNVSPEAITDWLKRLKERQWVSWKRRPNNTSLYVLCGPGPDQTGNCQNGISGSAKLAAYYDESKNKEKEEGYSSPVPPQNGEEDDEDRTVKRERAQHTDGAPSSGLQKGVGVSNSRETFEQRNAKLDAWWTTDSRIGVFEHVWSHWPKQAGRDFAMEQFRLAFEPEWEADPMFGNRLWRVVQWQLRQWEKEEREQRYVPSLGNRIKRGMWRDAPEEIR
jgi:hypothetical protein